MPDQPPRPPLSRAQRINALIVEMRELAIAASFGEMDEPERFDSALTQAADWLDAFLAGSRADTEE